jgi:phosphatidate cytidylyltransferase
MFAGFHPLVQRLIASVLVTGLLALAVVFSFTPYVSILVPLLSILFFGAALKEYYDIAKLKGFRPRVKSAYAIAATYLIAIYLGAFSGHQDSFPLYAIAIGLLVLFTAFILDGENPMVNIAITLFGIVYLIIPLGCILQINYLFPPESLEDGRWWVFYLMGITYATDSFALFAGQTFGKHKLAPTISPKKTWEGAAGGLLAAVVVSLLFSLFAPLSLPLVHSIILGLTMGCIAQIGDLAESLLKRDVGVKDSSKIPGLGGMLDVVDSLVFTAPLLYLYLKF